MKIRTGFISNSSSSSFIIRLDNLTCTQRDEIFRISEKTIGPYHDAWYIREEDGALIGYTSMDNGMEEGMQAELEKLGVDMSKVTWDNL